jgi:hypothetical protein
MMVLMALVTTAMTAPLLGRLVPDVVSDGRRRASAGRDR